MSLYCRENGMWYLKKIQNGKNIRISLGTKDKSIAKEIYSHLLLEDVKKKCLEKEIYFGSAPHVSTTPKTVSPKNNKKIFEKHYQEYLEYSVHKQVSKGTLSEKKKIGRQLQDLGVKYISDINQNLVNAITKSWENLSSSSIRKYIASIKAFLNYCMKKGLYDRKDYDMLYFQSYKVKVRDFIIEDEHWEQIITHIKNKKDNDFLLYLNTLISTGCRPREITLLQKENIDFKNGTAKIYQSKVKAYNTIFINDELLNQFEPMPEGYIFKGATQSKEFYGNKFSKLRKILELPDKYTLYTCRHTFATKLIEKTGDIQLVSRLLGHSNITITAKHYINRNIEDIRKILKNN
ncbi:MAG: tyrosine-type recombinase/integrase [Brevinema sp.]